LMLTYSYKIDIFFPHDHNLSVEEILKLAVVSLQNQNSKLSNKLISWM